MARPARVSPDRILTAAALEFAARGYAGARVDRIAARARVNKAMLYYHFGSKQAIYRAVLCNVFARVSARIDAISADLTDAERVEQVIAAMAAFIAENTFFPAIMLREVADGGVHLDRETLAALASVPRAVGRIVQKGIGRRTLRGMDPVAAYFTIFAPLVMYFAGAPIRRELAAGPLAAFSHLTPERFVHQLQQSVRRALASDPRSAR